jgi:hypothetical protein
MKEEAEEPKWWEVRYYTQHPYTDTTMLIAETESQAVSKFKKSDNGDRQVCNVTMIS